jgi:hypothetical protein
VAINNQLVDHIPDIGHIFNQAFNLGLARGIGNLASDQNLHIEAGHIDVNLISECLVYRLFRFQLYVLVFYVNAGTTAVCNHISGRQCATRNERDATG